MPILLLVLMLGTSASLIGCQSAETSACGNLLWPAGNVWAPSGDRCTPLCAATSVTQWPQDCATDMPRCGDYHCDGGETAISCPSDCTP